jgi:hypothetical protein
MAFDALRRKMRLAKKQYIAASMIIPRNVKGIKRRVDSILPQNEIQFTSLSLFVCPIPRIKHGQMIAVKKVMHKAGTPRTTS